jgi:tetratricopeptide (TPR) repeat protein
MKFDVFLSHNSKDKPIVEQIAHKLEAKCIKVWLDKWNLIPGDPWQEDLEDALDESQTIAVFVGPHDISPWENEEMRSAIEERVQDKKRRVIPVLLPGAPDNTKLVLPRFLKRLTWVDLRTGINDEDSFHRLISGIKGIAPGKTSKTESAVPSKNDAPPPVSDLPIGSSLPFPPNPLFEGRVQNLKDLAKALTPGTSTSVVITQAITGMGGLGKTQLAVEFAYRYGSYFRGVHWLDLANPSQLEAEIARCGMAMALANFPADQPSQVALTLNTWKADGPRLLVLDNFEAVEHVNEVLPRLRHSNLRLLVTSRRMDWPATAGLGALALELFSPQESLAFLKNALVNRKDKETDLQTLAERLGHLPLALELAGRYLNGHTRLGITEYLEQTAQAFDHPSMKDWRKDLPVSTAHDLNLQHTFALSWEAVKEENAQKLFMTAGYLAPNTPIPLEIFEAALEISSNTCDELLNTLYGLGLLRKGDDNLPTIHPLLAEYTSAHSKENDMLATVAESIAIICTEKNEYGIPNAIDPFRAHLEQLAKTAEKNDLPIAGSLWNNIGFHYSEVAAYIAAKDAHEHGIAIKQKIYGDDEKELASDYGNLGRVMYDLGDLPGARTSFEHALKIDEANFGPDHPMVAIRVNNLGLVIQGMGDLPGARAAYERAIKIWKTNLGEDHPQVAKGVNNLGSVMKAMGNLPGARTAFERALKISEKTFGKEHPQVADSLWWLGVLARDEGNKEMAKDYFERALQMFKKFLPPEHPTIKNVRGYLDSVK